ncbi:MAG: hypothetical protein EXR69_05525 [Myxococcales bacterium]|nr:hypothetical protein [Myxococcales bacterium]
MIPLPSLDTFANVIAGLDAHSVEQQVNWMRGLGKRELVALWDKAVGSDGVALAAPLSALHGAEGEVVIHEGQNSLPLFNVFQKRCMLRTSADGPKVQGYNHQAMSWITGPGHFLVQTDGTTSWFDYTQVATDAPPEFPPIKANTGFPDKLVYGGMVDKLRKVGARGLIGAALRPLKGELRETGDYFMLIRR